MMKIALLCIAGYLVAMWLTASFVSKQYDGCASKYDDYWIRKENCGYGSDFVPASVGWPIYWFFRTATH